MPGLSDCHSGLKPIDPVPEIDDGDAEQQDEERHGVTLVTGTRSRRGRSCDPFDEGFVSSRSRMGPGLYRAGRATVEDTAGARVVEPVLFAALCMHQRPGRRRRMTLKVA